MTEKEILQQQETNGQKTFYLIAVGMFYHAYGCGAFALARATGYSVLRKHRKHGDISPKGEPQSESPLAWLVDELQSFNLSLSTPMDAMILIARIQRRLREEQKQKKQEESPEESATEYRIACESPAGQGLQE